MYGENNFSVSIKLDLPDIKCAVYYLLRNKKIVYIGSTSNGLLRILSHTKDKDFDEIRYLPQTEETKFTVEAREIVDHKPEYNKSLPPNKLYAPQSRIKEMHKGSKKIEVAMALCKPVCVLRDTVYYNIQEVEWVYEDLQKGKKK
jgi:hypothetical protein